MDHRNSNTSSNGEIPHLKGWFLKEKQDVFKRRGTVMGSSNRRWFTIDEENGELALSYCKRPNSERSGWLFLSDVLSIAQDQATNFITIEHPSRILRIQSPTPAQHRVWFSTLSKCCNGVVASPSSPDRDRRPSLPYFMNAVSPARRNSVDAVPSTPADQLKFLREITRGRDASSDKENEPKIFSPSSNESIASKDFDIQEDKHAATKATPRSIVKDLEGSQSKYQLQQSEIVDFPDVKQTTNRIHEYTKISTENKENESEVGNCEDVCSFHASSVDSTDLSVDGANDAVPVKKQFDMNSMKLALKRADDTSSHSGFHISTSTDLLDVEPRKKDIFKNQSFTSVQTGYSRSSSYQNHFDVDDEVLKPDENFVTEDWDDE